MNWVITGATGLIGHTLVDRLISEEERVYALARSSEIFYKSYDNKSLTPINFDISSGDYSILKKIDGAIGLIMLASKISVSKDLRDLLEILNVDCYSHLNLIEQFKLKIKYCLYASSCTVYGYPERLPVSETAELYPQNVYALAKTTSEKMIREICQFNSIPLSILRITQVYGPGAIEGGAMYNFLKGAHENKAPQIGCNPETYRDYCYVDDVVTGIESCLENKIDGTYNIGSGRKTSILELSNLALEITGSEQNPKIVENDSIAENMWLDITKARKVLDYKPKVDIKTGLTMEYKRLFENPVL